MRDAYTAVAGPIFIEIDGHTAAVGWPRRKNEVGQLSIRYADGETRPCTEAECERFVNSLSHYYFVPRGDWAQAYGVVGSPLKPYRGKNSDGGGSLV